MFLKPINTVPNDKGVTVSLRYGVLLQVTGCSHMLLCMLNTFTSMGTSVMVTSSLHAIQSRLIQFSSCVILIKPSFTAGSVCILLLSLLKGGGGPQHTGPCRKAHRTRLISSRKYKEIRRIQKLFFSPPLSSFLSRVFVLTTS